MRFLWDVQHLAHGCTKKILYWGLAAERIQPEAFLSFEEDRMCEGKSTLLGTSSSACIPRRIREDATKLRSNPHRETRSKIQPTSHAGACRGRLLKGLKRAIWYFRPSLWIGCELHRHKFKVSRRSHWPRSSPPAWPGPVGRRAHSPQTTCFPSLRAAPPRALLRSGSPHRPLR